MHSRMIAVISLMAVWLICGVADAQTPIAAEYQALLDRLAAQDERIRQLESQAVHGQFAPQQNPPVNAQFAASSNLEQRVAELEKGMSEAKKDDVDASGTKPTQKWFGRIHLDYWSFPQTDPGADFFETGDVNNSVSDRFLFRRMRFGVQGDIGSSMLYKIAMEWAVMQNPAMKDAFLGWKELPILQTVLLGNQKRPYGLDALNSSRYNVFIERPFINDAFILDSRRVGLQSYGVSDGQAWNWRYGAFLTTDVQSTGLYLAADNPGNHHYQSELAARLANTIWYDESSGGRGYAHWAIAGSFLETDGTAGAASTARFRSRPEARTTNRWLDTGTILGAENMQLVAGEGVINVGPVQVVGEYIHINVNRTGFSDVELHGGYAYVSWFLTGEHMPWNRQTGTLGRIKPFENFFLVRSCEGQHGWGMGAWQLAARYSYIDMSQADVLGGVGSSLGVAANWYWTPYSRVQFNYSHGNIEQRYLQNISTSAGARPSGAAGLGAGDYSILGVRCMVDF